MKNLEENLGLLNSKEINDFANFEIAEEPIADPSAVNWRTGAKAALSAGAAAAVWLPCAAAAAV